MSVKEAEHSVSFSNEMCGLQDGLLVTVIPRSFGDGTTAKVWPPRG